MIESLFYQLLQVAIGTRQSLSVTPSAEQWMELFALSKKQALVGIAFAGVTRLNTSSDYGASLGIPEIVYLKWLGMMAKIQQRNKEMNAECIRLAELLSHDGFHCCILKGQSNLVYYPEELRECRTSGDIDVLFRSVEKPYALDLPIRYCLESAQRLGAKLPHVTYHHADLAWEGVTEVEGHYRATFLCSPLRNWRLQHWLEENMPWGTTDAKIGECVFPVPSVSYNAIYQLLHIFKHLFEEGIGLRQLLDYYFVLRALHIEQGELYDRSNSSNGSSGSSGGLNQAQAIERVEPHDSGIEQSEAIEPIEPQRQSMAQWAEGMGIAVASNEEIMHTLSRFGMKKFAGAVMWVLAQVFDSETKTIKTPSSMSGSTNLSLEESSVASENKLSASTANSSNGILTDAAIADGDKQSINPQPSTINLHPWMICEPNEKEGKFLLNEIMMAGNFGKYDTRISHEPPSIPLLRGKKVPQQLWHAWEKLKHNMRLVRHYPEEVLWEPFFRLYHYSWRKFSLWRY